MNETKLKLLQLLLQADGYIKQLSENKLTLKSTPNKWSKKEILGHLIDSALNNLQRFTEIQHAEQPYKVRPYLPDELVAVNDYQNVAVTDLLNLWLSLNKQILNVLNLYTEEVLAYRLITEDGEEVDLNYWTIDYVSHMEHHLNQIMS